jgi:hypothetical protein
MTPVIDQGVFVDNEDVLIRSKRRYIDAEFGEKAALGAAAYPGELGRDQIDLNAARPPRLSARISADPAGAPIRVAALRMVRGHNIANSD